MKVNVCVHLGLDQHCPYKLCLNKLLPFSCIYVTVTYVPIYNLICRFNHQADIWISKY